MLSLTIMILLCGGLWWWYFTLKADARRLGFTEPWMFPFQLWTAWIVTVVTLIYIVFAIVAPEAFGETVWL